MSGDERRDLRRLIIVTVSLLLVALGVWFGAQLISEHMPEVFTRSEQFAFGLCVALGSTLVVAAALRWVRRSWAWIGLTANPKAAALGIAVYAVAAGLAGLVSILTGSGAVVPAAPFSEVLPSLALLAVIVLVSEAWPEELVMRGFLLSSLDQRLRLIVSLPLQAALFTAFAFVLRPVTLMDAGFLFTFGLALAMSRAATGSLWTPIGLHLALMTTQQILGGGWSVLGWSGSEDTHHLAFVIAPLSAVIVLAFDRIRWSERQALCPRLREKRL